MVMLASRRMSVSWQATLLLLAPHTGTQPIPTQAGSSPVSTNALLVYVPVAMSGCALTVTVMTTGASATWRSVAAIEQVSVCPAVEQVAGKATKSNPTGSWSVTVTTAPRPASPGPTLSTVIV